MKKGLRGQGKAIVCKKACISRHAGKVPWLIRINCVNITNRAAQNLPEHVPSLRQMSSQNTPRLPFIPLVDVFEFKVFPKLKLGILL